MNIQFDTQIKLKQCTSLFGGVFLDNTTKWGNLAHSFDKASILNEEGCVRLFTYLQNLPRWLPRLKNFIIEPIIPIWLFATQHSPWTWYVANLLLVRKNLEALSDIHPLFSLSRKIVINLAWRPPAFSVATTVPPC